MNVNPELYNRTNLLQARDGSRLIERIADEYKDKDELDKVLDIGCGTGNITVKMGDRIKFNSLIGIDISSEMVQFAQENYSKGEKIKYKVGDVCADWGKLTNSLSLGEESHDLIVSIYCLHWVRDKQVAMQNIGKLLKPGGKCFILLFAWSDMLPIQQEITLHPKWRHYFRKTSTCADSSGAIEELGGVPPFAVKEPPNEHGELEFWKDLCVSAGLTVVDSIYTHTYFGFQNLQEFQDEVHALCHFVPYIPFERQSEFLKDYFDFIKEKYVAKQRSPRSSGVSCPSTSSSSSSGSDSTSGRKGQNGEESSSTIRLNYDYITVVAQKN